MSATTQVRYHLGIGFRNVKNKRNLVPTPLPPSPFPPCLKHTRCYTQSRKSFGHPCKVRLPSRQNDASRYHCGILGNSEFVGLGEFRRPEHGRCRLYSVYKQEKINKTKCRQCKWQVGPCRQSSVKTKQKHGCRWKQKQSKSKAWRKLSVVWRCHAMWWCLIVSAGNFF